MDYSINKQFDEKCLNSVKQEMLRLVDGYDGRVFLFGSRAKGVARRGSDIDIGIEGMPSALVRKLAIQMNLFWEESFVPYHLDIVDFDKVRDDFRNVAMEKIVIWKKS